MQKDNGGGLVVASERQGELTVADVLAQQSLIQQVLSQVMTPGHHYGIIPGTERIGEDGKKEKPKPVLHKPGAEKLGMVFRLAPQFDVQLIQLPNGHREVRATCTLTHIPTGAVVANALGSCSTMESKYRWRNGKRVCPDCGVDAINKSKKEAGFYCWSKLGGCGATFGPSDTRITAQEIGRRENPDIADVYNTVLKMAEKRAHVAAVLLATAASDMFIPDDDEPEPGDEPEQRRSAPQQRRSAPQARELTPKEQLIEECTQMNGELVASGLTRDGFVSLFEEAGIPQPKRKWGELSEDQLVKAKAAMAAELKKGSEVQS